MLMEIQPQQLKCQIELSGKWETFIGVPCTEKEKRMKNNSLEVIQPRFVVSEKS